MLIFWFHISLSCGSIQTVMKCLLLLITAMMMAGASAFAVSGSEFSKYDIILARKPFGAEPAKLVAATGVESAPAVTPQNSFAKDLRMIAITDDDLGARVGLYDLKGKRSFFIEVGRQSEDGIMLLEADFEEGGALLRKGDENCRLFIDGRMEMQDGTVVTKAGAPEVKPAMPSITGDPGNSGNRALSYIERLRLRREELKKAEDIKIEEAAARRSIDNVDKEKLLREYNLELIRAQGAKGMPLPMELTREEDAMLVKEGVLPPQGK